MKVEISNGELLDKISILQIKLERISDESKLKNIQAEYTELTEIGAKLLEDEQTLYMKLKAVNQTLWDIEDRIRIKEKEKIFDQEFVDLARSVYITNDKRADIKKEINILSGSYLIEEKSYEKY
jgi:predicted nuclease with TOPRIM domain